MSFRVNGNMFFIDGAPICTLDFTDFHECDERKRLVKALTEVNDKSYNSLFSEEGLKDTKQRISYVLTKDNHFAIAEPYCDYIFLGNIELHLDGIDKMKAFVDLIKHPKVKFIPLKEGLTWFDIIVYKAIERLDLDLLFKRKQIEKLFSALFEYLDNANTKNAKIIKDAGKTFESREYYSQNIPIPDEYFRMGWNIGTCDGYPIDSLELETEILKKNRLFNKKSLAFNHGKIDTFLTESEEDFKRAMRRENTPLITRPLLMYRLLKNVPNAQTFLEEHFPNYNEIEAREEIKEVTAYKNQKDYIAGRKNILRR